MAIATTGSLAEQFTSADRNPTSDHEEARTKAAAEQELEDKVNAE